MTGLIPSKKLPLSTELLENPFPTLFVVNLPVNSPLVGKAQYLKEFSVVLSNLESKTEDAFNRNHWGSIASGFSAAITIAGSASLVPVVGWILSGVSVVAAAASIGGTIHTKSKVSPVIETLKRHRLALESQEAIQWAALWELAGTDLFCRSLGYASRGVVSGGKLVQQGDDSPFMRAVDFIAECRGMGYEQVITSAAAIKSSAKPAPLPDKSVGQNTKLLAIETDAEVVQEKPVFHSPEPDQPGIEILDALVSTRRSTLLVGDTGSGKSITQAYILSKLFENHPSADVYVLTQKADSFCGLASKGRVTLFDPIEPEQALALITKTWRIYDKRRRLPESERPALHPVRLILADWLSINQALDDLKNEEEVRASKYLSKLADIIYNGRELNVCLLVDLQSYNLAAVGLKADRNSRKNFNLIGLGNYSVDELGMVNESYGVLTNLIGDRYIVAEESERAALNATFKQLQPISKQHRRPIIFSSLSPARLALLPDLRSFKTRDVPATSRPVVAPKPAPSVQPQEEMSAPTEPTNELRISDSLGEPLKTLWLFAKKKNDWVTVRNIYDQKFKVLESKKVEQIHQYLGLLADSGLGEIDEEGKAHSAVGFRAY